MSRIFPTGHVSYYSHINCGKCFTICRHKEADILRMHTVNESTNQPGDSHGQNDERSEIKSPKWKSTMNKLLNPHSRPSLDEAFCRICLEDGSKEALFAPCACKGTLAHMHPSCLEHWLHVSNLARCELCHYEYNMSYVQRFGRMQSVCMWLRDEADHSCSSVETLVWGGQPASDGARSVLKAPLPRRQIVRETLVIMLLTPLTVIGIYLCVWASTILSWEDPFAGKVIQAYMVTMLLILAIAILVGYGTWLTKVLVRYWRQWARWHRIASMEIRVVPRNEHAVSPPPAQPASDDS